MPSDPSASIVPAIMPWFRGTASEKTENYEERELDPIVVAGCMKGTRLSDILESWTLLPLWILTLTSLMDPTSAEEWCGMSAARLAIAGWSVQTTARVFRSSLNQLKTSKVFKYRDPPGTPVFSRYFEVPKKDSLFRAILDCRLNWCCKKPPSVRFATWEEIFMIMRMFATPAFLTLDLRHWFYQLALPSCVYHYFTVRALGMPLLNAIVWPMGFSWSPLYAQSIITVIIVQAFLKAGLQVNLSPDDTTPPPVIFARNKKGEIVAAAVCWYDNVIVAATNTPVRDGVANSIRLVCKDLNVIMKNSQEDKTHKRKVGDTRDGIERTIGEVDFLGVHFESKKGIVHAKHITSNIDRWEALIRTDWRTTTPREIACIVGVCIWDWVVKGNPKGNISNILAVASEVGSFCSHKRKWDEVFILNADQIAILSAALTVVLKNDTWEFSAPSPVDPSWSSIFLASDAMGSMGAGMTLNEDSISIILQRSWTSEEKELHINIKETIAGIETVEIFLSLSMPINNTPTQRTDGTPLVITLGVDNVCAKVAFDTCYFPTSEEITMKLLTLRKRCDECGVILQVVHVPGILQAASRSKQFSFQKVKDCRAFMTNEKERLFAYHRARKV